MRKEGRKEEVGIGWKYHYSLTWCIWMIIIAVCFFCLIKKPPEDKNVNIWAFPEIILTFRGQSMKRKMEGKTFSLFSIWFRSKFSLSFDLCNSYNIILSTLAVFVVKNRIINQPNPHQMTENKLWLPAEMKIADYFLVLIQFIRETTSLRFKSTRQTWIFTDWEKLRHFMIESPKIMQFS